MNNSVVLKYNFTSSVLGSFYGDLLIHPHWKNYPPVSKEAHAIVGYIMIFIGVIGSLGNALVIWIFGSSRLLRTPANLFIINLAFSDFLMSTTNFPLVVISSFKGIWYFGKIGCDIYGFMGGVFGLMSIVTLAAIAMDRNRVISRPFDVLQKMTTSRTAKIICFIWIYCLILASPPLFGWSQYVPEGFLTSCSFEYLDRNLLTRSFILYLFILGFALPCLVILFCYIFIIKSIYNHEKMMAKTLANSPLKFPQDRIKKRSNKKLNNDIQAAKIAFVIIILFCLSWIPYAIITLIGQFGNKTLITPWVSTLPAVFAKASTMYNPLVYAISNPYFRKALIKQLPCPFLQNKYFGHSKNFTKWSRSYSTVRDWTSSRHSNNRIPLSPNQSFDNDELLPNSTSAVEKGETCDFKNVIFQGDKKINII
uniref:Ek arthropsin n=1 Tax=Euperipatoides kanangrensis TaxID=488523 RepID=T2I6P9_9BILA|nr:Ek arthropsin [Euperipatoides kanangrensis]